MGCLNANIASQDGASCLSATLSRIGNGLSANVSRLSHELIARIENLGETFATNVETVSSRLVAQTKTIDTVLSVRCSIICTLDKVADFLEVTPDEIQWITDDVGVFYDVKSNVDWIIVTS